MQQLTTQISRGSSLATPKASDLTASSNKQADMYISELLSYSLDRMRKVSRVASAVLGD